MGNLSADGTRRRPIRSELMPSGRSGRLNGRTKGKEPMPRERLRISSSNRDLAARFALGLRDLLTKRGSSSRELCELVNKSGVKVDKRAVDHWLAGRRL